MNADVGFPDPARASESPRQWVTADLDRGLLATPFDIQTNWHVITGAPSCGKTTLIDLLAAEGLPTVPEGARRYMEGEIARGRTIEEIHDDGAGLQRAILDVHVRIESRLSSPDLAFLDGSLPTSISWFRVFGLNPNEALRYCFQRRYASVFVLDRLPLHADGIRFEDDAHAAFLDEWIARDHQALGYEVVKVPVAPPEDRLALILGALTQED